jgi:ABC-2 type transport system ATP-binding protein
MRQRLAVATALLGEPPVLILDEPANGLDPEGIRWMRDLLKALAEQGRTVLVSSHLLSEMEILADDIVIVAAGKLVRQGTVAEIIDSMGTTRMLVRTPKPDELVAALGTSVTAVRRADGALLVTGADGPTIGAAAMGVGAQIHELTTERPDLENVFLQLTAGKADIR